MRQVAKHHPTLAGSMSANHLYALIQQGAFPARDFGPRKKLILCTAYCTVHREQEPDDVSAWLKMGMDLAIENAAAAQ